MSYSGGGVFRSRITARTRDIALEREESVWYVSRRVEMAWSADAPARSWVAAVSMLLICCALYVHLCTSILTPPFQNQMQWWPSGVEQNEDGVVREVPQRHVWASSIWITQDGVARRKWWWNSVERRWHWDAEPLPLIVVDGRAGIHSPGWMSVERAICMAWRLRSPDSTPGIDEVVRVRLVDTSEDDAGSVDEELTASTLRWAEEEEEEDRTLEGETWKPLKGGVGAVPIGKGYSISSKGRLRDARGRVTRGAVAFGRRLAAVAGAGLVDLYEAAGLDGGIPLPLSIRQARGAILANATPVDLARHTGISLSTAWSYFCRAAVHVEGATLRLRVRGLVDPQLWEAVQRLRGQSVLGGPLSDLWEVVAPGLPPRLRRDANAMSMLRLARTGAILPF